MNDLELKVFEQLFREAVEKCFGHALTGSLSETESKLFHNKIYEATGLVIGWKSLKNYSLSVLEQKTPGNPSVPTLDTLARYVLQAPYTDELSRKEKESHFPYWFDYKNRFVSGLKSPVNPVPAAKHRSYPVLILATIAIIAALYFGLFKKNKTDQGFQTDFAAPLVINNHEWWLKDADTAYWNRRNQTPGYLSLFTLAGDNWPDTLHRAPVIRNLLFRALPGNCFTAELQLKDFVPRGKWQQAGLLLMEDTSLASKTIRLSLGYNDNFGGFLRSPEIILQAIVSYGRESGKPEEIIHHSLFSTDSLGVNPSLLQNFNYSTLQIEKKGKQFRFLYAGGNAENGAMHEISTKQIDIVPRYIGLFALKGFVDDPEVKPVLFKSVAVKDLNCPDD